MCARLCVLYLQTVVGSSRRELSSSPFPAVGLILLHIRSLLAWHHPPHMRTLTNRVADGALSFNEAKAKNKEHYKRFYGKPMPDKMFF